MHLCAKSSRLRRLNLGLCAAFYRLSFGVDFLLAESSIRFLCYGKGIAHSDNLTSRTGTEFF